MGNVCATREDSPRETARQYETYTARWHEVIGRLSDDAGLTTECLRVYREECQKQGLQQLSKRQWQEMTGGYINRISCKDQRTKERIYCAVDDAYPGPGNRAVSEATFIELSRLVLTLAEQDLRAQISKFQQKQTGVPPTPPKLVGSSAFNGLQALARQSGLGGPAETRPSSPELPPLQQQLQEAQMWRMEQEQLQQQQRQQQQRQQQLQQQAHMQQQQQQQQQ
eukprot:CAMPEP_0171117206 /NCGR_PEP_ID=MMETSP0766_2-20121228/91959_1 /TAXON_ID=439317 /ORGANISM="Gambierdiscus australes, Strain CAWD 149" /LENGTH=223 /DNA_ID=CAMNT_0011579705 /DNA_START=11 /DNA_END=679 /DNA_ORIENTATION=+